MRNKNLEDIFNKVANYDNTIDLICSYFHTSPSIAIEESLNLILFHNNNIKLTKYIKINKKISIVI